MLFIVHISSAWNQFRSPRIIYVHFEHDWLFHVEAQVQIGLNMHCARVEGLRFRSCFCVLFLLSLYLHCKW